jgi:hypothetical protein
MYIHTHSKALLLTPEDISIPIEPSSLSNFSYTIYGVNGAYIHIHSIHSIGNMAAGRTRAEPSRSVKSRPPDRQDPSRGTGPQLERLSLLGRSHHAACAGSHGSI